MNNLFSKFFSLAKNTLPLQDEERFSDNLE